MYYETHTVSMVISKQLGTFGVVYIAKRNGLPVKAVVFSYLLVSCLAFHLPPSSFDKCTQ